jgi:hypothetical protein
MNTVSMDDHHVEKYKLGLDYLLYRQPTYTT